MMNTDEMYNEETYLNWQKMSAYSAEMLEACRTVTLKVKTLPILRCSRESREPSRLFSGPSCSSAPAVRNIRHWLQLEVKVRRCFLAP